MFVVVAYDISATRRRNRVVKILSRHGERVNLSVFECTLTDARAFTALRREIGQVINPRRDHVRYYPLCRECQRKIKAQGNSGEKREEPVVFV